MELEPVSKQSWNAGSNTDSSKRCGHKNEEHKNRGGNSHFSPVKVNSLSIMLEI